MYNQGDPHIPPSITERVTDSSETLKVASSKKGISWSEFVIQIFVNIEGPAIFVIPLMFQQVGYLFGIIGFLGIGLFYTYILHIYLWCDNEIRIQKGVGTFSLYSLIEHVFADSNHQRIGQYLKVYLKYEIILSWSLSLSFGVLYATKNIQLILDYFNLETTDQSILLFLLIPTTFICWIPNIQSLAFFSYIVIFIIIVVMIEVLYYVILSPIQKPQIMIVNDISSLPNFLFSIFFTITFTPLLFPLQNEMKYPKNLRKSLGGLNICVALITLLNVVFTMEVYMKLGDTIEENILANLPQNTIVVIINCLFTFILLGSGALSFFVIFHTIWVDELENYFIKCKPLKLYEYIIRTLINLIIVFIAMIIPTFSLFINIISCFSYPFDSVILPIILESVILLNKGNYTFKTIFLLIKNLLIGIVCLISCIFAFVSSVLEILSYYKTE